MRPHPSSTNPAPAPAPARGGFTLLEIIIAMSIGLAVIGVAVPAMTGMARQRGIIVST
jgi:prepilin-type N-terminal cleavage/methylation domain-containing protein